MSDRETTTDSDQETLTADVPLIGGALAGAVAYLLAYLSTYVLVLIDSGLEAESSTEAAVTETGLFELGFPRPEPSTVEFVGWILSNAHFVETVFSPDVPTTVDAGDAAGSLSVNFLSEASTQFPEIVYHLVPVVFLGGAGYLLARRLSVSSGPEAVKAGGTLLVGYLPLSLLGALLFATGESADQRGVDVTVTAGPELSMVLLTALAFPAIFGIAGALLARSGE